ncbi:P-loop containing nucleoside triphosphate hydrolase protein [Gloeophyllum trabeum ATCC 11539]|uniref:p-loop containing nucleoside triphosphate hydrolase protein n=1 Tax=Gloeophyllum trabeum (strain ATCC 11539 / FP-39264 / Madison 617) TaxID=670483 RepID=S7Q6Z4_GLOTA|nr:P-loop containing nucleoside triphosphate hydrolase protein [Gloeophyllum trabeum ATCC 11539]EPQ55806.1 P-loop containing nucleoside triphosphate hydrolase protein [Gloeophyllum trabeum ATCC 11539]
MPTLWSSLPSVARVQCSLSHASVSLRARYPTRPTKTCQRRSLSAFSSLVDEGANLSAAEREWLQEDDLAPDTSPALPSNAPRYDWRLRARSRVRQASAPLAPEGSSPRRALKRIHPPHVEIFPGEPFHDEIQAYKEHFLPLLDAEQKEDEAILKERLSNWPLDRLKEEGYCLTGLSAFWLKATQFGRPVAAFLLGPGIALPDHRFDNGTQVLVSRLDPLQEKPLQGSVVSHTTTQIRVAFPELYDLDESAWRLDVGYTNVIYERMRTAIGSLVHDPALLEKESDTSASDRQLILQGTHLRDKLLRSFASDEDVNQLQPPRAEDGAKDDEDLSFLSADMRIHSWIQRYSRPNPVVVEGDPVLSGLNPTQIRAIALMVGKRMSLVQGPPGTGKTKTIIEAVKLLKVHWQIPQPVLVCTFTNVAVDNLVEGLARAGVRPLRVGYGKVRTALHAHTLEEQLQEHRLRKEVDALAKEVDELREQLGALRGRIVNAMGAGREATEKKDAQLKAMEKAAVRMERKARKASAKRYAMSQEMLWDIVTSADVVCTTCVTSACAALNIIDFPMVFLDEASMSTEPASLIPIMKGSQQVALIGDHKQLPPVITSAEAQSMGLGVSLFERLTEERHVPSIMLDVQYRMHPAISRFPSIEFYQFSVQDGTVESDGSVHPRLLPPASSHLQDHPETGRRPSVIFLDHAGSETLKHRSRVNWTEAGIVCSIVEDLLLQNAGLRGEDIGIIAPYAAQISLLTRLLRTDHRYRTRFTAVLGEQRAMQLAHVEIKTVDGFEGREKEVIVFSTVRNNARGHIGFLGDRRRLNVGLTRAKRGLFVVGSLSTLREGKVSGWEGGGNVRVGKGAEAWRRYAKFLSEEGLVVRLSGERLRKTLYGNITDADVLKRVY